jgi:hypothetical protein
MKKPLLSFCGVDELAFVVCQLDLRNHRPFCSSFMDTLEVREEFAKLATTNAYSYQKIGSKLFAQYS